ncbi:MAG: hypothetical protein U5L96_00215 [Owenweeksia sp.]|nr:hypothetical protein [Owenweeksia sp.]
MGELQVNNHNIPYKGKYYKLRTDSSLQSSEFVGKTNSYDFTGTDAIPDFERDLYCPDQTDLTYTGLENDSLPANASLTLSWTPDPNMPEGAKAGIIISSLPVPGNSETGSELIEVDDSEGQHTIKASVLSKYSDNQDITLWYIRGYNELEEMEGKDINFKFIGYSWTTLLIKE